MDNLLDASDLSGFPGAPFKENIVAAVADAVRHEVGWHIAPERTETVEVDTDKLSIAILPTLRVSEVQEVRNAETGAVISGWTLSRNRGLLRKKGGNWPTIIEVDLTHGYEKCPPALLPVLAEWSQRARAGLVSQESLGSRSVSFRPEYDRMSAAVVGRFALPPRP